MNIILLEKKDFIAATRVSITGRRAEHINGVLRAGLGQTLKIGMVNSNIGQGVLRFSSSERIEIETDGFEMLPPEALPITLIVAMQRPKTMKKIIQSATAMGVKKFIIIETWKVEKSYWNSPLLQPRKLAEQLRLGLEQGGDTIMPTIDIKRRFKPFIEDELPAITATALGLVAHPGSLIPCPRKIAEPVVLAIGPEGGFRQYEIEKMSEVGMQPINIGLRPLRSEFAVTATIAKLF